MNADYVIELTDGSKVNLLFNTWTFRNYSYKKGIEMEQLFDNVLKGEAFKANDLPTLLVTSAQSYARSFKEDKVFSEDDACEWMDDIGMFLTSPKVMEIYKLFVAKLVNVDPKILEVALTKVNTDEPVKEQTKKKKAKA